MWAYQNRGSGIHWAVQIDVPATVEIGTYRYCPTLFTAIDWAMEQHGHDRAE